MLAEQLESGSTGELRQFVERQWVARIAAGDRWALRILYEMYFPRLAAFFAHLMTEAAVTETLINATLHSVWRSGETFDPDRSVYVWIMQMALGHARRHWTSKLVRHRSHAASSASVNVTTLSRLAKLSIEERAVMYLVYTCRSRAEIAEIVGVSVECVDTLLSQARLASATYANLGTDLPATITDSQNIATGRTQRPLSP